MPGNAPGPCPRRSGLTHEIHLLWGGLLGCSITITAFPYLRILRGEVRADPHAVQGIRGGSDTMKRGRIFGYVRVRLGEGESEGSFIPQYSEYKKFV